MTDVPKDTQPPICPLCSERNDPGIPAVSCIIYAGLRDARDLYHAHRALRFPADKNV